MHPVLIQLGPFHLYTYGALIALGGILSVMFWRTRIQEMGLRSEENLWLLVNVLLLSGFIGGRLLYVFEYVQPFSRQFWTALISPSEGFSVMGAFASVILGVYLVCRRISASFPRLLDYVSAAAPLWHAFGRLGCFAAGCCYGRPTGRPWGVVFTDPRAMIERSFLGRPVHPTQLYEAGGDLVIAAALFFLILPRLEAGRQRPGIVSVCYFGLYAALRFVVEFYRADAVPTPFFGLTAAQGFCLLLMALSAGIFLKGSRHASNSH